MKNYKIFAALAALALMASACEGNENYTEGPAEYCVNWYRLVNAQNNSALDPFNLAYRLNVYLNEMDDVTIDDSKKAEIKRVLLGEATDITNEGSVYTLKYNKEIQIPDDSHRMGWVVINTYGNDLNDVGATWSVTTDSRYPYAVNTGYGWMVQGIREGSYLIEAIDEYRWNISADDMNVQLQNDGFGIVGTSIWSIDFNITQTQGIPSYESLKNEYAFSVTTPSSCGGTSLSEGFRFRYTIQSPVIYSSLCNVFQRKAGGTERIEILDQTGFAATDYAQFEMGKYLDNENRFEVSTTVNCTPDTRLTGQVGGEMVAEIIKWL